MTDQDLQTDLKGSWKAKAFDGELHESWTLEDDGWLLQQAYYIVENDTSYRANTRILKTSENGPL